MKTISADDNVWARLVALDALLDLRVVAERTG
jgi:hypothetical protein